MIAALVAGFLVGAPSAVEVRFVPEEPSIGDPLIVFLRGANAPESRVEVFGMSAPLLAASDGWVRAFVAVPLDVEPRVWPVRVVSGRDGLMTTLIVRPRAFRTSSLKVSERFTAEKRSKALEQRLAIEQAAWDAVFAPAPGPLRFDGSFVRPVRGSTTSEFGVKRTYNGRLESQHYGLDLDGRAGEPVAALQGGIVVMSAMRFNTGGTVVIDHGNGLFTAYFHLSRRLVREGAPIAAGAVLGKVGATGRVTGPHLHLAAIVRMEQDGAPRAMYVDPERLMELDSAAPGAFVKRASQ
ncbi:MAG: M23 family metallopeptidase [Deltaproteobacteria bacterium]|nr:M23 family metallopeptidase [Deltaproteobacteria bacterium]